MPATIEAIFELYDRRGGLSYGEGVSQLDHALQCAELAARDDAGTPLVAAALLHDIGHLLEPEGPAPQADARHEAKGARMLGHLFGPEVTRPIALHVAAKRYLCTAEDGYEARLSAASRHSLGLQGGPLSQAQARRFEAGAHFASAVRLRRYDEDGKLIGTTCPPLRAYSDLLRRLTDAYLARRA